MSLPETVHDLELHTYAVESARAGMANDIKAYMAAIVDPEIREVAYMDALVHVTASEQLEAIRPGDDDLSMYPQIAAVFDFTEARLSGDPSRLRAFAAQSGDADGLLAYEARRLAGDAQPQQQYDEDADPSSSRMSNPEVIERARQNIDRAGAPESEYVHLLWSLAQNIQP